jgi:uncharacterized protein (TIGR03437 family)
MKRRNWIASVVGAWFAKQGLAQALPIEQSKFAVPIGDEQGKISFRFPAFAGHVRIPLDESTNIELACIPGGSGLIGEENQQWIHQDLRATPVRQVRVTPFLLGVFEVTRGQWLSASRMPRINRELRLWFAGPADQNSSRWPVEDGMATSQIEEFCARLKAKTNIEFRLPSETEWEYACRAGTSTRYHFGNSYGPSVAGSELISFIRWQDVGSINVPNRFGLHDMHGGVVERCADWRHVDYQGAPDIAVPRTIPGDANRRIIRGGISGNGIGGSAYRHDFTVEGSYTTMGFRVAASYDHGVWDVVARSQVHAATFESGSISPGQVVTLFGENLGPGLVEVYFDDRKAVVLFADSQQVNVVAPFGIRGQAVTRIVVRNGFQSSHYLEAPVVEFRPGLFTLESGLVAAVHTDGRIHGAEAPVRAGEVLALFGSGLGPYAPQLSDGEVPTEPRRHEVVVRAEVGGRQAQVEYAGAAPGLIAGVTQINVRIPAGVQPGRQPVRVYAQDAPSQAAAFLFVA